MSVIHMEVEKFIRVDRLTESNHQAWSNVMRLCLRSINAWRFIEGAIKQPKEEDLALFYRASALIASSVGPESSYLVLTNDEVPETSSPYRLWTKIEEHFNPKSKKNLARLKCQLFAAKIEPDEEISKYIERVNALANQLNSIIGRGHPEGISRVTEGDRMAVLVEGVAFEYPEAYNAMSLMQNLNLEQAVSFMTAQCVKPSKSEPASINALKASRKESKPLKKCSHCGRNGHSAQFCYDLHPELQRSGGAQDANANCAVEFPII